MNPQLSLPTIKTARAVYQNYKVSIQSHKEHDILQKAADLVKQAYSTGQPSISIVSSNLYLEKPGDMNGRIKMLFEGAGYTVEEELFDAHVVALNISGWAV